MMAAQSPCPRPHGDLGGERVWRRDDLALCGVPRARRMDTKVKHVKPGRGLPRSSSRGAVFLPGNSLSPLRSPGACSAELSLVLHPSR